MRTIKDTLCPNEIPSNPIRHVESRTLKVICDRKQVFPDDPGMGTPIIVECKATKATATLNCAEGERELESSRSSRSLTDEETAWLNSISQDVNDWVYREGKYAAGN